MKTYGLKRSWNAVEDYAKWGRAYRQKSHRKDTRLLHRSAQRTAKHKLRRVRVRKEVA